MKTRFEAGWGWLLGGLASLGAAIGLGLAGQSTLDQASKGDVDQAFRNDTQSPSGCGCSGCSMVVGQATSAALGYFYFGLAALAVGVAIYFIVRFIRSVRRL